MHVLVTGGAGFIGSHIVDACVARGWRVSVIDNLSTGDRSNLNAKAEFHEADLRDPATMRVHMDRYHPIGRMFADRYCRTDDRVVFPPAEGATGP